MKLHHVRNLVRHDACQLRFMVCRLNRPQVHEDGPTGQRERIDLLHIDHMEVVGPLYPGACAESLAPNFFTYRDTGSESGSTGICFITSRRILLPQLNLFLLRKMSNPCVGSTRA